MRCDGESEHAVARIRGTNGDCACGDHKHNSSIRLSAKTYRLTGNIRDSQSKTTKDVAS